MAKKAFLVGVNQYSNPPKFNLRGCVNDIESLTTLLVGKYEFDEQYIRDHRLLDQAATGAAIRAGLESLLQGSQPGDVLVFGFAGHGSQLPTKDEQGEIDGKDEVIVPHDISRQSLISDDDITSMVEQYIPNGNEISVNFTAIYDCCHSGTMIRELVWDNATGDVVEDFINRYVDLDEELRGLPAFNWAPRDIKIGSYNVLSACMDEETAADLRNPGGLGVPRGVFSFVLHRLLTEAPNTRFKDLEAPLLEEIQKQTKHKQTPQYYGPDADATLFAAP